MKPTSYRVSAALAAVFTVLQLGTGCGSAEKKKGPPFFTSGNREADQRAEQRVAKDEQLKGTGEEKTAEGPVVRSLYERLGGEAGIRAIADDFVPRALADPRVNWQRQGVTRGGFLGFRARPVDWIASEENVAALKLHLEQFIALATGGPSKYQGRHLKQVHRGMKITNSEFDASIGDLKATLDKLGLAAGVQKELLAVFESTRLEIVEQR